MKIYINGRFLTQSYTGVQNYSLLYSRILAEHYTSDIIILIPKFSKIKISFPHKIKKIGINVGHLWEQIDFPIYLRLQKSPLLINFGNSAPLFYSNKFITIHDLSIYINKSWYTFVYRNFYKFLIPNNIKRCKKIITVSKFSRNEISVLL